jgi:thiol-disulfide isomerase/thioredoxin
VRGERPENQSLVGRALPPFKLPGLSGRTWTLDDLKGKITFINVWATWCPPCREELPWDQKLHERRGDFVVLTLNADEQTALVQPYAEEQKLTVPVLLAHDYVVKLLQPLALPRTWIVDRAGVIRAEYKGFGRGSEAWLDRMIDQMEKLR